MRIRLSNGTDTLKANMQGTEHNYAFSHALNITYNVFTAMTPSSSVA